VCGYFGDRDEALVAYLYDDTDSTSHASFDAHLVTCARCREEVSALRGVRAELGRWSPPESASTVYGAIPIVTRRRWWETVPAWAQVAAALLCVGVAAGIANLDVRYDSNGLTLRTGWSSTGGARPRQEVDSTAWRTDLAALERRLRTEFHAPAASTIAAAALPVHQERSMGSADAETLRRVRALVDESERRQQRELALRLAEVMREVDSQRQADLVKIDRSLGVLQNNTGVEVLKQRELLNYLVRASQRQ
jgi:hypothetical protein